MNWFIYCKRLESLGYAFNTYCEMCQILNYAFATFTSFRKCEYISGDRVIYASSGCSLYLFKTILFKTIFMWNKLLAY